MWRRPGERFHQECILLRLVSGHVSVSVWGCVSHDCKLELTDIRGNMTGIRNRDEILATQVEPHIDGHPLAHRPLFMHDGASMHTARVSQEFLNYAAIDVMPWPSMSPDLNIIEHLWDQITNELSQMENKPQNAAELRNAIHVIWQGITLARIRRLVRSCRRRCEAVIAARGGNTCY